MVQPQPYNQQLAQEQPNNQQKGFFNKSTFQRPFQKSTNNSGQELQSGPLINRRIIPIQQIQQIPQTQQGCPACPPCNKKYDYSVLTTISNLIKTKKLNYTNLSDQLIEKLKSLKYPNQYTSYNNQNGIVSKNILNPNKSQNEQIKDFFKKKKEILNQLEKIKQKQLNLINKEINKSVGNI